MLGYVCGRAFSIKCIKQATRMLQTYCPKIPHLVFYEDNLQMFFLALNAKNAISIQEKLYLYTSNKSSITQVKTPLTWSKKLQDIQTLIYIFQNLLRNVFFQATSIKQSLENILQTLEKNLILQYRFSHNLFAYPQSIFKSFFHNKTSKILKCKLIIALMIYLITCGKIKK